MNRDLRTKLILILITLIPLILVFIYVYPLIFSMTPTQNIQPTEDDLQKSLELDPINISTEPFITPLPDYNPDIFESDEENEAATLFFDFINNAPDDYFSEGVWNWQDHWINMGVRRVNKEDRTLEVSFLYPKNKYADRTITVNCTNEQSALFTSYNLNFYGSNLDIFDALSNGQDYLYTFCQNEQCTEIGTYCIVLDTK